MKSANPYTVLELIISVNEISKVWKSITVTSVTHVPPSLNFSLNVLQKSLKYCTLEP